MGEKRILTAAELMGRSPATVDVPCAAWDGVVRLRRLDGPQKLRFALGADRLIRDDAGRVQMTEPANWAYAVDLLAASIVGEDGALQFDGDEARTWLGSEISAISELVAHALRLNGMMSAATEQEEIDAAKKD